MSQNDFNAAQETLELVGKTRFFEQLRSAFMGKPTASPRVVFIIGRGGIGKTRRLKETLLDANAIMQAETTAATELVDLYHVPNHTRQGLAFALHEALPPSTEFREFERERIELERKLQHTSAKGIREQRDKMMQAFSKGMLELSNKQPVLLALDTAEKLIYRAAFDTDADAVGHIADGWQWLLEALPSWGNIVLLIAGRPQINSLTSRLPETLRTQSASIQIEPFTEAESLEYFDKVTSTAKQYQQTEVVEAVQRLDDRDKRVLSLCSRGVPIMHALLIDTLAMSGEVPELLTRTPEEIEALEENEREKLQNKLEEKLVLRLIDAPSIGHTIRALGRAPKGVDSQLLAALLNTSIDEAKRQLDAVKGLTFVKTRSADERVFLHDEMYAMLGRQLYRHAADEKDMSAAYSVIRKYYENQIKTCIKELDAAYAPIERLGRTEMSEADQKRIAETQQKRSTLLTDDLYYRMRADVNDGFRAYYRYTREAGHAGDSTLDLQYQSELSGVWDELKQMNENVTSDIAEQIRGMFSLRDIARSVSESEYKEALDKARLLRDSPRYMYLDATTNACLEAYEATALTELSDESMTEANTKANKAVQSVDENLDKLLLSKRWDERHPVIWRARAVKALAYRSRGYLKRVQGLMDSAVSDYQIAVALWDDLKFDVELALTKNYLGFALSEMGNWESGRAQVNKALEIRRRLGSRVPIALSLNTLGLIDMREGNFDKAIMKSQQALTLFRALHYPDGVGLALIALSEMKRRRSSSEEVVDVSDKMSILREAEDHASEALEIFQGNHTVHRQVEALIEHGCALRDRVKVRVLHPDSRDNIARLVALSENSLNQAAELARDKMRYRHVDALINIAWLRFYARQDISFIREAMDNAQSAIPNEYHLLDGNTSSDKTATEPGLWAALGKLMILRGHVEFDMPTVTDFDQIDDDRLKRSAQFYTKGLQYSQKFPSSSITVGQRDSKNQIEDRYSQLSTHQKRVVTGAIKECEQKYKIIQSESVVRKLLTDRSLWVE